MTKEETIQGLQELYDRMEDAFSLDECAAVSEAIKKLANATIWTPCGERMPTKEDGGRTMEVNVKYPDGSVGTVDTFWEVYGEGYDPIYWSRIEPIQGGGNG